MILEIFRLFLSRNISTSVFFLTSLPVYSLNVTTSLNLIDYWAVALTLRWTDDNMKSRPLNSWFPSAASLVLFSGRKLFWDHSLCFLCLLKKTKRCSWRKVSKWTLTPQISHMKVSSLVYVLFSVWNVVSTALICQSEQSHHEVHLVITVPELSAGSSGVHIFLILRSFKDFSSTFGFRFGIQDRI